MTLLATLLIEVGILGLFHPQRVTIKPAGGSVLAVDGGTRVFLAADDSLGLRREGASIDWFAHRQLHTARAVTVRGAFLIRLENGFERRYRGDLRVSVARGELQLLLSAPLENLVAATVTAETPPGAAPATMEAQAIVARSFLQASKGRHGAFDLCDTTHCQHFKEASPAGIRAARATRGLVLTWQGKPFAPAYSASCGGRTQTVSSIGWQDTGGYPYRAVECDVCQRDEPEWMRSFEGDEATALRERPGADAVRIQIGRRLGWDALPGNRYRLEESSEGVRAIGRGQGHGLGYCQRGGAGMARRGASAAVILRQYFPGVDVRALAEAF